MLIAAAPPDQYVFRIEREGFTFLPIAINRKGIDPVEDISLAYRFWEMFKQQRPDVVLTYTPKPNIYASLAARLLKIPVINNVAGLGNVFTRGGILPVVVARLYRLAFSRSYKVFFQNNDDLKLFTDRRLVKRSLAERVPGSGVDTGRFIPHRSNETSKEFVFLLVARMLWDKGIGEFVAAARLLKESYPNVVCQLAGAIDPQNPEGISSDQLQAWVEEKAVYYHGASDNVLDILNGADCVVLPSFYREGVPRSLLEAASTAKPIITTDSVGCRDAVEDGITGYLCKVKDVQDLFDKMERMILLSERDRKQMGNRGREKMIREFDERFVIQRYIDAIENLPGHQAVY